MRGLGKSPDNLIIARLRIIAYRTYQPAFERVFYWENRMRVWGRSYNSDGTYQWVQVSTAANGDNSMVYFTWLCQVIQGNLGEDPIFSNWGIPAQQAVVTETPPDYWLQKIQQRFAPYFASLMVARIPGTENPTYKVIATCPNGAVLDATIPT